MERSRRRTNDADDEESTDDDPMKTDRLAAKSDPEQRAGILPRDNHHQAALRAAEGHVEQAARGCIVGKGRAVAGHHDGPVAFKPLGLVNDTDRLRRRGTKASLPSHCHGHDART